MMDEFITSLVSNRTIVFMILAVSLVTVIVMLHMTVTRIIPWRYTIVPGLIITELIVFCCVVLFVVVPSGPSYRMTFYSSLIWLQTLATALMFLVTYWISKRKNG